MAIRKVVKIDKDDEFLRKKSKPVKDFDENLWELLDDMKETMHQNDGVGIAAVQVGVLKRAVIVEPNGMFLELINPEIIWHSDEMEILEEGCLSFPEIRDDVARYQKIKVKYLDKEGNEQILEAEDYIAKVLQHEIDHTNGISFIDRLESYQKRRLKKELKELRNNTVRGIKKMNNRQALQNS